MLLMGISALAFLYFKGSSPPPGKENVSYILAVGTDPETDSRADAILLTVINQTRQEASFISIPSNTAVSSYDKSKGQQLLGDVYRDGGSEALKSSVENLLHIRINKYAVFTPEDFIYFVDKADGIRLYVEENMQHTDAEGNLDIDIRQGVQDLDGNAAFSYFRFLDPQNGELGRIQRQERLLKDLMSVLQEHSSFMNWALVKYYWRAYETDLTATEAADFMYHLTNIPVAQLKYEILPGEKNKMENREIWTINPVEMQDLLV